jgi:hypothetical protein
MEIGTYKVRIRTSTAVQISYKTDGRSSNDAPATISCCRMHEEAIAVCILKNNMQIIIIIIIIIINNNNNSAYCKTIQVTSDTLPHESQNKNCLPHSCIIPELRLKEVLLCPSS